MPPSSTSNSKTLQAFPLPTRAAALAALLYFAVRSLLWVFPDVISAYPESFREFVFYVHDQQCAVNDPKPQIVTLGTSRLASINFLPIGKQNWHTKDQFLNLSVSANSFWELAAVIRKHPRLLDDTDLQIIDIIPSQLTITKFLPESDPLFLRESTWREKWLIADPWTRAKAFADAAVPMWSMRRTPRNWYRALTQRPQTAEARLAILSNTNFQQFKDNTGMAEFWAKDRSDTELRQTVAEGFHGNGFPSRIQEEALQFLVTHRPPKGYLLLIRPPYREDFRAIIAQHPNMQAAEKHLYDTVQGMATPGLQIQWYESASEMGLEPDDYTGDGAHFSASGLEKIEAHLVRTYKSLFNLR